MSFDFDPTVLKADTGTTFEHKPWMTQHAFAPFFELAREAPFDFENRKVLSLEDSRKMVRACKEAFEVLRAEPWVPVHLVRVMSVLHKAPRRAYSNIYVAHIILGVAAAWQAHHVLQKVASDWRPRFDDYKNTSGPRTTDVWAHLTNADGHFKDANQERIAVLKSLTQPDQRAL
jgi:hypothetical protein